MRRALFAFAAALFSASLAHAELGRDDQWTYVPAGEAHGPMAELRGDQPEGMPTVLIFQIECPRAGQELVFRYFVAEQGLPVEPIRLLVSRDNSPYDDNDASFEMPTRRLGAGSLEGRLALDARIVEAVREGAYFMIYAPNDMGEAWHAGAAPTLKRLVRECWERPIS